MERLYNTKLLQRCMCMCACFIIYVQYSAAFRPHTGVQRPLQHSSSTSSRIHSKAQPTVRRKVGHKVLLSLSSQSDDSRLISEALPWLSRPAVLDGTLIGDRGFDPLGIATQDNIRRMRDSELRHGRLAMVALVGWPIAEVILTVLQKLVPVADVCTGKGCAIDAPYADLALTLKSIGGFSIVYWGSAILLAIATELALLERENKYAADGYYLESGDVGIDPFNLASDEMRLKEIKHGRLAMAAFLFHYVQVILEKKGVVFAHQMWGEVCVYNFRADLGFPPPICYPRPEAALDTTLSWEIMYRVLTGFFKEPYF